MSQVYRDVARIDLQPPTSPDVVPRPQDISVQTGEFDALLAETDAAQHAFEQRIAGALGSAASSDWNNVVLYNDNPHGMTTFDHQTGTWG